MDEWWSSSDVAEYLGVHIDTVRYWRRPEVDKGPQYRRTPDGHYEYLRSEVERFKWWADHPDEEPPAPDVQVGPPEPFPDPWPTPSNDLVDEALQEAARDAQQRAQAVQEQPDRPNHVRMAQDAATAAVRAALGVDPDPGGHMVFHAGQPDELQVTCQGLRLVYDCIGRALFYESGIDRYRWLIRSKADLGRAIQEERSWHGDFLERPSGNGTRLFNASQGRM